jgi:hypothetical protein
MTRRPAFTFVGSEKEDPKKAYCRNCEELTGRLNKLVPRLVNGVEDDKFRICSYCGEIYPIYDVKYFTEYEPKGYISDNPFDSGTRVLTVNNKRKSKSKFDKNGHLEEIEIPKIAGKEDKELECMLKDRPGILLNLNDNEIGDLEY